METVMSNEAVTVLSPESVYVRILIKLSELSPGQPRVITRPGSASVYGEKRGKSFCSSLIQLDS